MAKKETPQAVLEHWQATLATLEAQRAEVGAKRAASLEQIREIEREAKEPRSGGLRISEYEALGTQAQNALRTVRLLDDQIVTVKAEVDQARQGANHEKLVELRRAEKAQMLKVIAAVDPLWAEIVALGAIQREIQGLGNYPLAVIPLQLWKLLEPGLSGGRQWWANVNQFQSFDYCAD